METLKCIWSLSKWGFPMSWIGGYSGFVMSKFTYAFLEVTLSLCTSSKFPSLLVNWKYFFYYYYYYHKMLVSLTPYQCLLFLFFFFYQIHLIDYFDYRILFWLCGSTTQIPLPLHRAEWSSQCHHHDHQLSFLKLKPEAAE